MGCQCHGGGGKKQVGNLTDQIAAFLTGAGEYHYYGLGAWSSGGNFSHHWIDGVFDRKLGAPLADATYDASTSTWTRSFASGTKVRFNAETKKGAISWAD